VDEGEGRGKQRGKRQPGGKKMSERNDKDKDGNTTTLKKDKRRACFICAEEGHFANECPQ
jgi:hypothetical protein